MKKMYKKPIVEQTHMMPSSMVMSGSGSISAGTGGGTTGDIPGISGGDPVPGE